MLRILLALVLLAPLGLAAPASAADIKTLACVDQRVPAAMRTALIADFEHEMTDENYETDDALRSQYAELSKQCKKANGWSDEAEDAAYQYTLAQIALPVAIRLARANNVDADKVLGIWRAFPEAFRTHRLKDNDLDTVGKAMLDAGVMNSHGDGNWVGRLIAYSSVMDFTRASFIAA